MALTPEQAATMLRLLVAYANSGVPDSVSLECAQMCRVLREMLADSASLPAPAQAPAGAKE